MRWLAVFGCGHDGRLGLGTRHRDENVPTPVAMRYFSDHRAEVGDIVSVHVGGFHTLVRTTKGVFGFGFNDEGQLGTGEKTSFYANPTRISFIEDVSAVHAISCGSAHTFISLTDGLYSCGSNKFGQLGLGDTENRSSFTKVDLMWLRPSMTAEEQQQSTCVTHVSCGTFHTLIAAKHVLLPLPAKDEGETYSISERDAPMLFYSSAVLACGKGDFGELGYDADAWDLMATKEQSIKRIVSQQAAHVSMGGNAADSVESTVSFMGATAPTMKPVKKFVPKKVRRPEFFHAVFKPIRCAALDQHAAQLFEVPSDDATKALDQRPRGVRVVALKAMHLHSWVSLEWEYADPGSRRLEALHFGCHYCDRVEGEETSVPDGMSSEGGVWWPAAPFGPLGSNCEMLAAHEMAIAWTGSEVKVLGKGNIGLGDEDSFSPSWLSMQLPCEHDTKVHRAVLSASGKAHVLFALGDETTRTIDAVVGFGDNLFGQVGVSLPSEVTDAVLRPMTVLNVGARLRVHGTSNSVLVARIADVQCGARHSVIVFDDDADGAQSPVM